MDVWAGKLTISNLLSKYYFQKTKLEALRKFSLKNEVYLFEGGLQASKNTHSYY